MKFMEEKSELRTKYLEKRSNLVDRQDKSYVVQQRIIDYINENSPKTVFIYYAFQAEVETYLIIEHLLENNIKTYIPHKDELKVWEVNDIEEIHSNATGLAYIEKDLIEVTELDLAIIPGVAFTRDGKRLGRGEGWYDRFLATVSVKTKIGICFEEQIADDLPTEDHDIEMDLVISD